MELLAISLGLLVGLSLGALGGGGSTLAVPILVFVAGLSAQDATTASLLVVGISAAVGVIGHYRSGHVRLRAGLSFGAAGIVGSRIGTTINHALDGDVLLAAFAVLVFFVGVRMYQGTTKITRAIEPAPQPSPPHGGGDVAVVVASPHRVAIDRWALVRLALAATGVGLLTGLFGVGGGFAVVPALTLFLGFDAKDAIGTSLVVIAINAAVALGMRADQLSFDWAVVGPFLATVTVGVLAGSQIANRLDAVRLTRAFAVMLLAVAVYTLANVIW